MKIFNRINWILIGICLGFIIRMIEGSIKVSTGIFAAYIVVTLTAIILSVFGILDNSDVKNKEVDWYEQKNFKC